MFPRFALALVTMLALTAQDGRACSAFSTQMAGDQVVAKNFDWSGGGGYLVVNQRGRVRTPFLGQGAPWTARYGSLSFTVLGPGLPVSGMNEAGLVVESLVDEDVPASTRLPGGLVTLDWVQFTLDTAATVADVEQSLAARPIVEMALPLHFLVCDRTGACLAVEPDARGVHVEPLGDRGPVVIANRTWSSDHRDAAALLDQNPVARFFTPGNLSYARFATLVDGLTGDAPRQTGEAFTLLDKSRIKSMNRWQLVWDQSKRTVAMRQRDDDGRASAIRRVSFAGHDLTCKADVAVAPLDQDAKSFVLRPYGGADEAAVGQAAAVIVGNQRLGALIAAHTVESRCE